MEWQSSSRQFFSHPQTFLELQLRFKLHFTLRKLLRKAKKRNCSSGNVCGRLMNCLQESAFELLSLPMVNSLLYSSSLTALWAMNMPPLLTHLKSINQSLVTLIGKLEIFSRSFFDLFWDPRFNSTLVFYSLLTLDRCLSRPRSPAGRSASCRWAGCPCRWAGGATGGPPNAMSFLKSEKITGSPFMLFPTSRWHQNTSQRPM